MSCQMGNGPSNDGGDGKDKALAAEDSTSAAIDAALAARRTTEASTLRLVFLSLMKGAGVRSLLKEMLSKHGVAPDHDMFLSDGERRERLIGLVERALKLQHYRDACGIIADYTVAGPRDAHGSSALETDLFEIDQVRFAFSRVYQVRLLLPLSRLPRDIIRCTV
jgi:hypothetical protein